MKLLAYRITSRKVKPHLPPGYSQGQIVLIPEAQVSLPSVESFLAHHCIRLPKLDQDYFSEEDLLKLKEETEQCSA